MSNNQLSDINAALLLQFRFQNLTATVMDALGLAPFHWKTIYPSPNSFRPSARWGHSSCIVDKDLFLFGGFANTTYMNDLWVYSIQTTSWNQVKTHGDIPACRSNSTLNYDPVNGQLLLFGGGGPNRQRFNTISMLDLSTLSWLEVKPFQSEKAPWERTYHTAEFKYPYLIVFGGESAEDMGDLWIYNVLTLSWREVQSKAGSPCSRRFHSSCLVDNDLYVFGGCCGKYQCLDDLYRLNLASLFTNDSTEGLEWKQVELQGNSVARWGHTMHHFEGQLFIFGGRSNQDSNELLCISLSESNIKVLATTNDPDPRRRHHGGVIGSCLVLFGGFNGSYFDDFFFINLYKPVRYTRREEMVYYKSRQYILDKQHKPVYFWQNILGKYFRNESQMIDFLRSINGVYFEEQLSTMFITLIRGWGPLPLNKNHTEHLDIIPPEEPLSKKALVLNFIKESYLSIQDSFQQSQQSDVVQLEGYMFLTYLSVLQKHWQMKDNIRFNRNILMPCSKALLSFFSPYFFCLFSGCYKNASIVDVQVDCDWEVFRIVLMYLHTNTLVVPSPVTYNLLKKIALLGQYLSHQPLVSICQEALMNMVTRCNAKELQNFAKEVGMERLEERCALTGLSQLRKSSKGLKRFSGLSDKASKLHELMSFDLMHGGEHKDKKGLCRQRQQNQPQENLLLTHKNSQGSQGRSYV